MIQSINLSYRSIFKICCAFVLLPLFAFVVKNADIGNEIMEAFKSNNAKNIANYFGSNVSLSIKSDAGHYSKFQGEMLLNDFFQNNRTSEIKQVQRTSHTNSSFYIVYQLKSSTGTYRVFIKLSQAAGEVQITELRIE